MESRKAVLKLLEVWKVHRKFCVHSIHQFHKMEYENTQFNPFFTKDNINLRSRKNICCMGLFIAHNSLLPQQMNLNCPKEIEMVLLIQNCSS